MAKILIVDDDPHILLLLSEVLQREKHQIIQASDGSGAIELMQQEDFELVISDLHMKNVDGIQVLRAVKKKNSDQEVLILTGYATVNSAVQAMKLGAYDYLTKPLNIEELKFKVNQALSHQLIRLKVQEQAKKLQQHQEMIERDLRLAATIQETLVPNPIENDRIAIYLDHQPIIGVGGDFADLYIDETERLFANIVDVTGHGIAAALVVNRIYSEIYKLVRQQLEPKEILFNLNNFICHTFEGIGMFLTAFSFQIDLKTNRLIYAGCAHPPILISRKVDQRIERLASHNSIIGFQIQDENMIVQHESVLNSGDRVLLYTDGIIDIENETGAALGVKGLAEIFEKTAALPVPEIIGNILQMTNLFCKRPARDDIYLLLAELKSAD